ncbi:MAG: hypothetical protein IMY73_00410 [Bacteroidetes bacterium]|nr:hypothetical protein [Bacteroidota bacterium]
MKKLLYVLLLSLFISSCKKDEEKNYFSIETNKVTVDADDLTRKIWVKNSENWTLDVDDSAKEWLSFEKIMTSGVDTLVMKFKNNDVVKDRSTMAMLRDTDNDKEFDIDVTQNGSPKLFYISPEDIFLEAGKTEEKVFLMNNSDEYKVDHLPIWVKNFEVSDEAVDFKYDVTLTLEPNTSLNFRKDSIVLISKWNVLDAENRYKLDIVQLGVGSLEAEKETLKTIYQNLNGASWKEECRWDLTKDISTWKGVSIEKISSGVGERVVALQLTDVGIDGEFPSEIINLPYLKSLWLDNNKSMTGSITTDIGKLSLLESVRLGDTSISGAIPESISLLTNITQFSLCNTGENGVSGNIIGGIGNMTNLVYLDLSNNAFGGELPESIGLLSKILTLNVSKNKLTGEIPASYKENYSWGYWEIEKNVCPQREGFGFTNCTK